MFCWRNQLQSLRDFSTSKTAGAAVPLPELPPACSSALAIGADEKTLGLEALNNETVDLERIPIEEVFEQLRCTKEGLTSEEGENRLKIFGFNKLEENSESKFLKFLGFMWNPLSWFMEARAIMAIALANVKVRGKATPPDWEDFVGIVVLLLINSTI